MKLKKKLESVIQYCSAGSMKQITIMITAVLDLFTVSIPNRA